MKCDRLSVDNVPFFVNTAWFQRLLTFEQNIEISIHYIHADIRGEYKRLQGPAEFVLEDSENNDNKNAIC